MKTSSTMMNMSSFSPIGMRVLVVDDSPSCLTMLERLLELCDYVVTKCLCPVEALERLRANNGAFDIVVSDVKMPNMDGFELLRQINLEMDVPVILMSGDTTYDVVMKGINSGACYYMSKPPALQQVKNIWQHVVLKNLLLMKSSLPMAKPRKKKEKSSRPRLLWTPELHQRFVEVVNHLGIHEAMPKKILDMMGVCGLTRDNISSKLQRYRKSLAATSDAIYQEQIITCNSDASTGGLHVPKYSEDYYGTLNAIYQEQMITCNSDASTGGLLSSDDYYEVQRNGNTIPSPWDILNGQ